MRILHGSDVNLVLFSLAFPTFSTMSFDVGRQNPDYRRDRFFPPAPYIHPSAPIWSRHTIQRNGRRVAFAWRCIELFVFIFSMTSGDIDVAPRRLLVPSVMFSCSHMTKTLFCNSLSLGLQLSVFLFSVFFCLILLYPFSVFSHSQFPPIIQSPISQQACAYFL